MGNTHEDINKFNNINKKKFKKGQQKEVNSDDENDLDGKNILSEYDKELSHMLFEDESDNENENNIKNGIEKKKKSLKEELDNYAQEIAEEKFMEEINRSKSIQKPIKKNNKIDDDDDDEDSYAAFKRWKAEQRKKKKKKEENEKNEKDDEQLNIKTINNNVDDNLNINNVINDKNKKNNKKIEKIEEKRRVNSSDKKNYFKNKIKEKNENAKINNKNKKDDNIVIMTKQKEKFLKQAMKNYFTQNQSKLNNLKNNFPNDKNNLSRNEDKNLEKSKYNTNTYNPKNKKGKTFIISHNNKEKDKKKKSAEKEKKKSIFSLNKNEKDTNLKNKTIYEKMKKENIRIVTLYLKNGNMKYEEGLQLCGFRNYDKALACFAQSRNSFFQLNKLMISNTKDYPDEFRKKIKDKLTEKINLVNQSIRECDEYIKKGKNLKSTNKVNQILKNYNIKEDNNINMNFSQIDDSFDFNSPEPEEEPIFKKANNNHQKKINNNKSEQNIHDEEEAQMDAKIESEIIDSNPGVKFSDIIGMQEMKKILYEIIIVPSIRPDFFTGIRKPQRGVLLFGPPGTGKTMIAKAIASECKSTFFNISASSLTSKWVGESEKTVKSLFKIAYKKAPSIIFIDEIDSILSKRKESENEATKRLKTEFLIQFDGLGSDNNAKLLVIAATNRPMDLDEALLRRLPKRVYCGPLDANGRFEFIKKVINRVETNLSDKDIMEIAKMTNGYSNSDLKELCKEAAFQPVRELTIEQIMKIKKFRPLVKNDLILAVNKIRGTLSNKIIDELMKWNEQFGGI